MDQKIEKDISFFEYQHGKVYDFRGLANAAMSRGKKEEFDVKNGVIKLLRQLRKRSPGILRKVYDIELNIQK